MKKHSKPSLLLIPLLLSLSLFSCDGSSATTSSQPVNVNSSKLDTSVSSSTTTQTPIEKAKLTIITPNNITISDDYEDEFVVGEAIVLPTLDQISGLGTRELIGYFISDTDTEVISGKTLMIAGGMSVEMRVKETIASLTIINNTEAKLAENYQTEFKIGEPITLPEVISLPVGYELDGFYIQGTTEKAISGKTLMPETGLTLELKLTELLKVTINYPKNLEIEPVTIYVKNGSTIDLDDYDISDQLPDNYEFTKWWGYDENGDISINAENETTITSNTTIWFSTQIAKRIVEFILPDGISISDDYKREYEVGIQTVPTPLTSDIIGIPEGMEIEGWYYNGELYEGGMLMPKDGMTLELRLKAISCVVNVKVTIPNSNVKLVNYPSKQTYDYGDSVKLPTKEQLSGIAEDSRIEWYVDDKLCEEDTFIANKKEMVITLKVFVKVHFNLPDTLSVDQSLLEQEYEAGKNIPFFADLNSYIQYDEEETREIDAWYYLNSYVQESKANKYTKVPASGLILTPSFIPIGTPLTPGLNSYKDLPDKFGHYSDDLKTFTAYNNNDSSSFSNTSAIIGGESGRIWSQNGTLSVNDAFRLNTMTENGITADKHYRIYYHLKNCGTTDLSFDLYQINSQTDILSTTTSTKYKETITLTPNQQISLNIEITGYKNNNLLSMFVMKKEVANMMLGISMSFEEFTPTIDPNVKYTLTLSDEDDITFADGSKSIELAEGESLPEIINNTGKIIEGYHNDTKIYKDDFTMPAEDITIYPHYILDGYRRLWFGDGKEDGIPDNLTGGITSDGFVKLRDPLTQSDPSIYGDIKDEAKTIVEGGVNGFAQQGVLMQYNGTMKQDSHFRNSIVVNDKSDTSGSQFQLEKNKSYTYNFNFENKGDSKIAFQVTLVNSGIDKTSTGMNNTFQVVLNPNESMCITTEVSYLTFYSGSTNDNANILFEALEDMSSVKLGIAMSIKIPE